VIQPNCARWYERTFVALETGVERRVDVVRLQGTPRETVGIRMSHSAYEIRKRKRILMAIWKGIGLVVDEWTNLSGSVNYNVIAIDLRR
jgi:hypothetical protein